MGNGAFEVIWRDFWGNGRGMMMRWVLWVIGGEVVVAVGWKYTVSRLKNPD